jgi:hypothetical protein
MMMGSKSEFYLDTAKVPGAAVYGVSQGRFQTPRRKVIGSAIAKTSIPDGEARIGISHKTAKCLGRQSMGRLRADSELLGGK